MAKEIIHRLNTAFTPNQTQRAIKLYIYISPTTYIHLQEKDLFHESNFKKLEEMTVIPYGQISV